MSDPILLFLTANCVALLLLGTFAAYLPPAAGGFLAATLSGLGMLVCLPPLLMRAQSTAFGLPIGPPGLSLRLALDPLSAFFLVTVFLAGTVIGAFQATSAAPNPATSVARTPATSVALTQVASVRRMVFCVAGAALSLLAADGVTLAIGLAVACGAIWLPRSDRRNHVALMIPLLPLAACCLLTPAGFAPRFDVIRAAPVDPNLSSAAAALTIAAVAGLVWGRSDEHCWIRDTLTAGVLAPCGSYLLLRLIADLSGAATQTGCGFVLLLAGGAVAVLQGWCAVRHPDIDGSLAGLTRRQAGLAAAGVGLALIARAADLPGAASFALAATFLSAIGGSIAGVLTSLAAHAIGANAGTYRLSRLGGLVHAMPVCSAALSTGLLGSTAIPPSVGFASLWLLFQSILSAPRTGGLLFQVPVALIGAALALSAALATAGSIRLIGIALLGRPRTPRGAGARESKSPSRTILLVLAGVSLAAGVLPGPLLWLLADPAIHALTGAPPGGRVGLALMVPSISSPTYLALPVLALLMLATGAAILAPRWSRPEGKIAGRWANGMEPPAGLPFGEPAAQSTGEGFLPALPDLPLPRMPTLAFSTPRPPSAVTGLWLILAGFGALLLLLAVLG